MLNKKQLDIIANSYQNTFDNIKKEVLKNVEKSMYNEYKSICITELIQKLEIKNFKVDINNFNNLYLLSKQYDMYSHILHNSEFDSELVYRKYIYYQDKLYYKIDTSNILSYDFNIINQMKLYKNLIYKKIIKQLTYDL